MSRLERLVQAVRPGIELTSLAVHDDEVVLAGGGEVFRLPLAPSGSARLAVLVAALPVLRGRVPVAVAVPRWVGVMPDGTTPFTAEPLLPGTPADPLVEGSIAAGQRDGVLAAVGAIAVREAQAWGVPGDGELVVADTTLLQDRARGVLTAAVGWRLRVMTVR